MTTRQTLADVQAAVGEDLKLLQAVERLRSWFDREADGYDPKPDLSTIIHALEAADKPLLSLELRIESGCLA